MICVFWYDGFDGWSCDCFNSVVLIVHVLLWVKMFINLFRFGCWMMAFICWFDYFVFAFVCVCLFGICIVYVWLFVVVYLLTMLVRTGFGYIM